MEPNGYQNESRDHPSNQNKDEKRMRRRWSWSRLGSILGRSWGASWGHKVVFFVVFIGVFENRHVREKQGVKRRLGAILGRFGLPRGSKMRAAEGQKVRYVELS